MPEVIETVLQLRSFWIIRDRDGHLWVRYEGRRKWQSAFHKGRSSSSVVLTDYGPIVWVLGRDGSCNWAAMPDDEGRE
jgi:hypothetical protein